MACFCVNFLVSGCMLCLVCKLFIISTSAIDCLGRFISEMTYYVSSGTLNLTKPKALILLLAVDSYVLFQFLCVVSEL